MRKFDAEARRFHLCAMRLGVVFLGKVAPDADLLELVDKCPYRISMSDILRGSRALVHQTGADCVRSGHRDRPPL